MTSHKIGLTTRYKSGQSHEYQLCPSLMMSEELVLEEFIGKCDFCHSDCHFYAFLEQALQAEPFDMSTVQKFLIFNNKINI